jgi:hypothetical protein
MSADYGKMCLNSCRVEVPRSGNALECHVVNETAGLLGDGGNALITGCWRYKENIVELTTLKLRYSLPQLPRAVDQP